MSLKERMRLLEEAQRASSKQQGLNVPPPPVLPPKMTESSPSKLVSPVVKNQAPVAPTDKPIVEVKSESVSNARRMFQEMANKSKEQPALTLKPVMSNHSEPKPKSQPINAAEFRASTGDNAPIRQTNSSAVSSESARTEVVGKLPSMTITKTESQTIGQPQVIKPVGFGMAQTVQPSRPEPQPITKPLTVQPAPAGDTPMVLKPSQLKNNQAMINMLNTRVGGKPQAPPPPVIHLQCKVELYLENQQDQRDKFIVDRLFSEGQPPPVEQQQKNLLPEIVVETFANILGLQATRKVSDTIANAFTNMLPPSAPRVQQPPTATNQAALEDLTKQADQVIERGGAAKKNRKKKTESFDDM